MSDSPPVLKDFTGVTIECGDTIVYAVSHSGNVVMNMAKVTEITTYAPRWEGDEEKPRLIVEWLSSSWAPGIKGEQRSLNTFDKLVVIAKADRHKESHPEWEACRRG